MEFAIDMKHNQISLWDNCKMFAKRNRYMFRLTLISFIVGGFLTAFSIYFDVDAFEYFVEHLEALEKYNVDEFIVYAFIIFVGASFDLIKNSIRTRDTEVKRLKEQLENEKLKAELLRNNDDMAVKNLKTKLENERLRHSLTLELSEKKSMKDKADNLKAIMSAVLHITGNAFNVISLIELRFEKGTLNQGLIQSAKDLSSEAINNLENIGNMNNVKFVDSEDGTVIEIEADGFKFSSLNTEA
jgi:hypothetical protein